MSRECPHNRHGHDPAKIVNGVATCRFCMRRYVPDDTTETLTDAQIAAASKGSSEEE